MQALCAVIARERGQELVNIANETGLRKAIAITAYVVELTNHVPLALQTAGVIVLILQDGLRVMDRAHLQGNARAKVIVDRAFDDLAIRALCDEDQMQTNTTSDKFGNVQIREASSCGVAPLLPTGSYRLHQLASASASGAACTAGTGASAMRCNRA